MPGLSGWELLEEMERQERLSRIPVLVFSAHDVPPPPGRSFLAKPFRIEHLLARIEAILGGRR
jgi:DNA-binding response OmpR family regulator